MTAIPEQAWDTVSVDFGGPYPDEHYNLVVIDKRTRYPGVERLYSTVITSTKRKAEKNISQRMARLSSLNLTTDHHSVRRSFQTLQLKKDLGIIVSHLCVQEQMEKQKALLN